jgi:hypothetical protein
MIPSPAVGPVYPVPGFLDDLALCGDCLALRAAVEGNEGVCECGGDLCNLACCLMCKQAVILLLAGCRGQIPGLIGEVNNWSPTEGQVVK